jgi:pimeloyl-ACP methyl ester carboxylesterase
VPHASNPLDATRVYFEDDGGEGAPVVLLGGLLDSVASVRDSHLARSLPAGEFRLVFADHRGLGRSDKPRDPAAYAISLRVADAVAVLDELELERAHFVGTSYGGRLCFGIGEHAPERVLSLVVGGQQPYAIDPAGPLARVIPGSLAASRREGTLEPFVRALEETTGSSIPAVLRRRYLDNDPAAVAAAGDAMLAEGPISERLRTWQVRCLIWVGAGDEDFREQARRAADEIPNAEFLALAEADHLRAHLEHEAVLSAVLRTLRGHG